LQSGASGDGCSPRAWAISDISWSRFAGLAPAQEAASDIVKTEGGRKNDRCGHGDLSIPGWEAYGIGALGNHGSEQPFEQWLT
jgi:hypothetical protein